MFGGRSAATAEGKTLGSMVRLPFSSARIALPPSVAGPLCASEASD